jgi:hypothetical protein
LSPGTKEVIQKEKKVSKKQKSKKEDSPTQGWGDDGMEEIDLNQEISDFAT